MPRAVSQFAACVVSDFDRHVLPAKFDGGHDAMVAFVDPRHSVMINLDERRVLVFALGSHGRQPTCLLHVVFQPVQIVGAHVTLLAHYSFDVLQTTKRN